MPVKPLAVITLMVLALPVYGQKTKGKEQRDQKATEAQQKPAPKPTATASATSVNKPAADSQEQRHADQPSSYFSALFSPNNVANIALALVGIVGIVVALRSLSWLKQQTTAIRSRLT